MGKPQTSTELFAEARTLAEALEDTEVHTHLVELRRHTLVLPGREQWTVILEVVALIGRLRQRQVEQGRGAAHE